MLSPDKLALLSLKSIPDSRLSDAERLHNLRDGTVVPVSKRADVLIPDGIGRAADHVRGPVAL